MEEYFQSTMGSDKDAREERQLQVSRSSMMLMILFVGERQMAARSTAANGSTYFVEKAFFTGDGVIETEDGKIQFECSGMSADEVTA
jgi:hypothetical protein